MPSKSRPPKPRPQRWPDHRVDRLKDLVGQGHLSKSQIARAISEDGLHPITRNSICGKMDRLGLKNESRRPKMKMGPTFARLFSEKALATPVGFGFNGDRLSTTSPYMPESKIIVAANGKGIPFLESGMFECKFILGDHLAPNPRCCGNKTVGTTSWCEGHLEIVADPRSAVRRT